MQGQLKAATPAEYIAQLEESRKADVAALDAMIRKLAPKLAPFIHIGILAYGPRRYKYESGREGRLVPHRRRQQSELHFAVCRRGRRRRPLQRSARQGKHRQKLRALQAPQRSGHGRAQETDPRKRGIQGVTSITPSGIRHSLRAPAP